MKIFGFEINRQTPSSPVQTTVLNKAPMESNFKAFNLSCDYGTNYLGQNYLYKTAKGYLLGENGFYPEELNQLFHSSPLHSSILSFKRLLTTGNDYTTDAQLEGLQKISLNQLTNQFDSMLNEIAMDYFIHARICLKITWNNDNTKILKVERISPEKIHINDVDAEMKPINYLYNWDWYNNTKYPMVKYAKFDQGNKKDKVQLFVHQVSSPGQMLYSIPSYQSALNWVVLDAEMSEYHKANITNSINPSMLIQFHQVPETKEEKQAVLADLNNSFAGARKTGRLMVQFADGKELAPSVQQLEANKLDKTFLQLTDTIQHQITYSHQINPLLLGLSQESSFGNGAQVLYAFNLFQNSVIAPAQKEIENVLNTFLGINGIGVKIKLNKVELESLYPQMDSEVKMGQEGVNTKVDSKEEKDLYETPVNNILTNLTGKQNQHLDRILRKYDNDKLSRERAAQMLKTSFGFTDEEIEVLLGNIE